MVFTTVLRSAGANPAFEIAFSLTPEEIEKCFETNEAELLREVFTKRWNQVEEHEKLELSSRLAFLAKEVMAESLRGSVRSPEPK